MKKLALLLLCMILVLSFSSCNKDKAKDKDSDEEDRVEENQDDDEESEDENQDDDDDESEDSSSSLSISKGDYDFKTGLSTFITDYLNTKTPTIDLIDESEQPDAVIWDIMGLYTADLTIMEIPAYDALDLTGSKDKKVTGNLMFSGFEATKELDGDKIKFGYTNTYEEDGFGSLKGDTVTSTGYLDTKKNILVSEDTTTREGNLISKTVMEIARLKHGTFLVQHITYNSETSSDGQSCLFLRSTTDSLTAIIASGEPVVDFNYTSLFDHGDVSAEDLAKDFTTALTIKVADGEVTYE
ncbi:MAG: hypothetical protein CVU84_05255 [Firmicutes bacterium HGW-Firmicutes-1]|jgi:hypothetical protein|nr:MAG: hypothetical protein CVU84_05255 [Firmicutes bacterium HGW-Firmicutes-1]